MAKTTKKPSKKPAKKKVHIKANPNRNSNRKVRIGKKTTKAKRPSKKRG